MEDIRLIIMPDLPVDYVTIDGVTYVNRDCFLKVIYEETPSSREHAEGRPA